MHNNFVCQLTDARRMDKNKQYKKQLNCINKLIQFSPSLTLCRKL